MGGWGLFGGVWGNVRGSAWVVSVGGIVRGSVRGSVGGVLGMGECPGPNVCLFSV